LVLATKTDEIYDYLYYVYQSVKSIDQFTITLSEYNSNQRLTKNVKYSFPGCGNPLFVIIK